MDLSLVVITDDTAEYLPSLFQSIQLDLVRNKLNLELILVDNASSDKVLEISEQYVDKYFIFEEKICQRSKLYKQGFELAQFNYVIFVHSDVIFEDDFFENITVYLTEQTEMFGIVNFSQYYIDYSYFGCNQIVFDINNLEIIYKQIFQQIENESIVLAECSEACFMINKKIIKDSVFSQMNFYNSFFEYELGFYCNNKENMIGYFSNCRFKHYFIELHEKLITYEYDLKLLKEKMVPLTHNIFVNKLIHNYYSNYQNEYSAQLYIDLGQGFQSDLVLIKYINSTEKILAFNLDEFENVNQIRFDPIENECVIKITDIFIEDNEGNHNKIQIKSTNAILEEDNILYFSTTDPGIILEINNSIKVKKIIFQFEFLAIGSKALVSIIDRLDNTIKKANINLKNNSTPKDKLKSIIKNFLKV